MSLHKEISFETETAAWRALEQRRQGELPPGQAPELAHLAVIVGLVWRTVVMWMVLLALLTLARLLG